MNITDEDIKRICSANIYNRGLEYAKKGRIHIKTREQNGISAIADGKSVYSIRIDFKDEKISGAYCTCAYCQTMQTPCKHIVATLKKRQAELLEKDVVKDENDSLAQYLCSQFATNCFFKKRLNIKFGFYITTDKERNCTYGIDLKCGFDEPKDIVRIDEYLQSYIDGTDFKISKHTSINSNQYSLGENEEKIIKILCEAYQNRITDSNYVQRISTVYLAPATAKRIFKYLLECECDYFYNSLRINEFRVLEENPDILVDINATDDEISLNVSESGVALFNDGSWYFYDNSFYHTEEEWRSWFMPIYKSLMTESRTQIDFKGSQRIDFATYVYPKIRNKQGVIVSGVDSILINEKPVFSVYLDCDNKAVTAVVIAKYGAIEIRIPDDNYSCEKIVIRDVQKEDEILEFFNSFAFSKGTFTLTDAGLIYDFITKDVEDLRGLANVYASDSFEGLKRKKEISIDTRVKYNKEIDLFEVGFDTELSYNEIVGILNAVKLKEKYYRLADGSFVGTDMEGIKKFHILDSLNFYDKDIKAAYKEVSKYYALYLKALKNENLVTTDNSFDELIESIEKIDVKIPKYLKKVLRDYQVKGVKWIKQLTELGFGGILADDMGLGKTLEVIAFVMSEQNEKPSLVVAPSALVYNWQNEINKFANNAKVKIIDGTKDERAELLKDIKGFDFVITSYPLLRRDIALYSELEFSYLFIDESQNIKNPDTMNSKSVKRINAKNKFALSGTPIENNLMELWSVFDYSMKGYLNSRKEFSSVYDGVKSVSEDREDLEELRKKVKPFILRRLKQDVLNELPEKIENTIYCELVPEQKKIYEAFLAVAKNEINELPNTHKGNMQMLTLLLRLRQICCHPALFDENYQKESGKLEFMLELVESAISQGRRILVFSQFTSMLEIIREELKTRNIDCFYIDGKTPGLLRLEMADRFNGGEKSLFLVSLKAGGVGLNLTGADMVIHYDPWWNPAVMAQATDRAYRIGQKKAVQVIKLCTKGTIEEQILKLQEAKQSLADSIIRKNDKTISGLTKEEILSLFR